MARNAVNIDPRYRTKVYKYDGAWRLSYWVPFGGFLYGDFSTWEEAMADACLVESYKEWA